MFAEKLKQLRTEKNISQAQLAEQMFVSQSTIARWENGSRLPDVMMISRLARHLDVDINTLLYAAAESDDVPNIIIVDDMKAILSASLPVLEKTIPHASIVGFTRPSEAIEYARKNRIALAFLDIEMGKTSGLELCRTLLQIHPHTNVVFLTAYNEYALDAWDTEACGFLLKPVTPESVRQQLALLRYPLYTGGLSR
jgi:transcriptional regulator with XRE-family HTH domain